MKKDPFIFLQHILECIEHTEMFMTGVSQESFFKNIEKQSAVVRQIEIIGEAAKNIPSDFKDLHPQIPWKSISGMRDKLTHHYFAVHLPTVWKTAKEEVPALKKLVLDIIKKNQEQQSPEG